MNIKLKKARIFILIVGGAATGFVNGFFGGGGGMIAVPILISLLGTEKKKAHATAIAVILPLSVLSGAIYLLKGTSDIPLLLSAGGGIFLGGILGASLLKKLSNDKLETLFYCLMILSGVFLVTK
ncbi:MAG: TSUP family transporter [Clostridiales bacterium]|jgi:uncharacterized membrane protein YfcA|nr:TSUP family transporter [Clostridiales bacterium]